MTIVEKYFSATDYKSAPEKGIYKKNRDIEIQRLCLKILFQKIPILRRKPHGFRG